MVVRGTHSVQCVVHFHVCPLSIVYFRATYSDGISSAGNMDASRVFSDDGPDIIVPDGLIRSRLNSTGIQGPDFHDYVSREHNKIE